MARDLKAKIKLTADTKLANRNLQKTAATIGVVGTATRGLSAALSALAAAFTAATIAGAGILLVFAKVIGLANDEEDAIQKLNAAIGNLNGERELLSQRLQDNADALAAVTTAGNEEILAIEATISIFVKSEAQIIALTRASLDFAAAQNINGVSAAQLLTKTFASTNNALTRYGLVVEGAALSTERFASQMEALNKFNDQAASQAETTRGKIGLLADSFTDALEQLGLFGTSLEGSKSLLDRLTGVLNRAGAAFKFLRVDVGDLALSLQVIAEKVLPSFLRSMLNVNGVTEQIILVNKERNKILQKEEDALNAAAEATDELTESIKKQNDELIASEEAIESTLDALRKLGVTLDIDVNAKLVEQADLLDALHEAYNSPNSQLSRGDFERSQTAIGNEVEKLNGSLVEQVDIFGNTITATDQYSAALRIATGGLDDLTAAEIRNADTTVTSAQRRATARLNERNLGTQVIFGQRTTVGGTFSFPDVVVGGANGSVKIFRPGEPGREI